MSYRPESPPPDPTGVRTPNTAPDVEQKEPFIKKRDTWHTFALPPGEPPRRGLVGFLKYVAAIR